jgi:hypothetical protein
VLLGLLGANAATAPVPPPAAATDNIAFVPALSAAATSDCSSCLLMLQVFSEFWFKATRSYILLFRSGMKSNKHSKA